MSLRPSRRGVAALAVLGAALGLAGAAPAGAVTRTLDLSYVCNFPLLKPQPLELHISSEIPATATLGEATEPFPITAVADVSAQSAKGLRALETASLEGTARAAATIEIPGTAPLQLSVRTTIVPTSLPATGGFSTTATGQTPALTLPAKGTVRITVSDLLLQLSPKLSDGTKTGLEDFETECTVVPGQNQVLAEIIVDDQPTNTPPSAPGPITAVPSERSISLAWPAATDPDGIKEYDVYQDGSLVQTVTTSQATVNGLTPDTSYRFKVRARDTLGLAGDFGAELTATTSPVTETYVDYGFTLAGTSYLRTLTQGSIPLSGTIDARLKLSDGSFTANLVLNNTRARLSLIGLIPVTAIIGFVPSGDTTGTLTGGKLETRSRMKIRLPQLYLFGAIPVAGPGTCQTRQYSQINLASTEDRFQPLVGGPLHGTYAISDLTGCGALNGIISPLAQGGGNTIDINLSPKPVA